jgi:hypothetical protein
MVEIVEAHHQQDGDTAQAVESVEAVADHDVRFLTGGAAFTRRR